MRQRKVIKTTLGDLIAAVTDEVMPILRDPAGAYMVVSWVVNDVLTRQLLRDRKQFPAAARQFYEAAKLKPAEAKTWTELGDMLYMTGDYPNSLAAFEQAARSGESTPGNWFLRAIILDKLRQMKPAKEAYERFLSLSQGKNPDQEFQARQRVRILTRELDKR